MVDQPRPVWLDSLGADTLRYYAARAESSSDQALLYGLADAWDSAPANPTEAVHIAITEPSDHPNLETAVLRALGMPYA